MQIAMVDEVFANASAEQATSFFEAVGRRLAAALVLPSDDWLLPLEHAINGFWQPLGLGHVSLAIDKDGIAIIHDHHAAIGAARSPAWPQATAAVVFGAYCAWFAALGGAGAFHTRLVQQTSDQLVIHHGV
ncbi:hypothetical protein FHS79_002252 [Polymorphobacter multimanifer]|uniref:Cellulose synthase n=2 Tax=Polymorphobacter multimanifer TaxID=1070431 RepID=A0A841L633_9SPHN|nr:hypothetical protein [Polymorphobacter multimanifer]MBB6228067.1 hypothetical protein [Polymorphobacter multimanifer]